jgi:hypothetical protein
LRTRRRRPVTSPKRERAAPQADALARASAFYRAAREYAAGVDILMARRKVTPDQIRRGKERLQGIVRMLMGLIKTNSTRDYDQRKRTN